MGAHAWRGGQLFSLLAAATVAGYLALDFRYRLPVAGAFVAPITVAVMVPAHLVNDNWRQYTPELTHSAALALHVGSATLGTAALALAFGLSLVYLASEKQLKEISSEFKDITVGGDGFRLSGPLPMEFDEPALDQLTRLVFRFNRRDHGRLRMLIDRLNDMA